MPGVQRDTVIPGTTPAELYAVVTDYEAYPRFFTDFTRVIIHDRQDGLWTVEFKAQVVREVSYTLAIQHDPEALTTRWTFVRGTLVTDSTGGWSFSEAAGGTKVAYQASLEVNAPLPGFIKRRIQDAILNRSIGSLFEQLSGEARRRQAAR